MKLDSAVAVLATRMSSSRFPGKVLAQLQGTPLLDWVVGAVQKAGYPIIVATSTEPSDDKLAAYAESKGYQVHRGSLHNVMERVYAASEGYDYVLRVTHDCPLIPPDLISQICTRCAETGADYVSNVCPPTYPDGWDVEVFRRSLIDPEQEGLRTLDYEHLTTHIRRNLSRYIWFNVSIGPDEIPFTGSLTIDDPADCAAVEQFLADGTLPQKKRNTGIIEVVRAMLDEIREPPCIKRQIEFGQEVDQAIPGGAQTFSKMPHVWCKGFGPRFYQSGSGCYIKDLDNNSYLDTVLGLGAVTIGYLSFGFTPLCGSLSSVLEFKVARLLLDRFHHHKMVRFFKNGTDATTAAVRLARHCTGRRRVVSYGYHGWSDVFVTPEAFGPRASGSIGTDLVHCDDFQAVLDNVDADTAAVIVEPANQRVMSSQTAHMLRRRCDEFGIVLIFDEIVTFPRFGNWGQQYTLGIEADLTTVGKGIGNGAPISALLGGKSLMREYNNIFCSGTFGGERIGLEATMLTLNALYCADYSVFCEYYGSSIRATYNETVSGLDLLGVTECIGDDHWPILTWRDDHYTALQYSTFFQQEMLRRGILCNNNIFFCLDMQEDHLEQIKDAMGESLNLLKMVRDLDILSDVIVGEVNTGGVRQ